MASSTTKKAMIRRFERETLAGFISPVSFLQPAGLELLKQDGSVAILTYTEIKTVCFVKEFDLGEIPLEGKLFHTRPKMDGLWVRMTFRDGEVSDGILPNNLLRLDRYGYTVIPPEPYSNNQRIFVPRQALTALSVLGVVGSPLTRDKPLGKRKVISKDQTSLFE